MTQRLSVFQAIKKYFTTAPIIFPLIGLFHVGLFIYVAVMFWDPHLAPMEWFRPIVVGVYAWFWIGACFLRKRLATAYLILTMVMTLGFFFFKKFSLDLLPQYGFLNETYNQFVYFWRAVSDILLDPLPANILFSFIILFYYRRMKPKAQKEHNDLPDAPLPVEKL